MSSCDTFYARFQSEVGDGSVPIGPEERWLSTAAGGLLAAFGLSQLRLGPLAALGAGAYLVYRGASGRCPLKDRLARQSRRGAFEAPWESDGGDDVPSEGPWEGQERHVSGATAASEPSEARALKNVDCVDEAAMESFPASDPPSYTGTTASPAVRIE